MTLSLSISLLLKYKLFLSPCPYHILQKNTQEKLKPMGQRAHQVTYDSSLGEDKA